MTDKILFYVLLSIIFLSGCVEPSQEQVYTPDNKVAVETLTTIDKGIVKYRIYKFEDDGNTCYVYSGYGINCVKE